MVLFGKKKKEEPPMAPGTMCCPTKGTIIPLKKIEDGVFSEGKVGRGCGIKPLEQKVFAPADGKVTMVADALHAIGLTTTDGVELLIHVGMDTVDMGGKGFKCMCNVGDEVKTGDLLLRFDIVEIQGAGHQETIAFVVTNTDEFNNLNMLEKGGIVDHGKPLFTITK